MKRFIITLLVLLLAVPVVEAGRKRKKVGKVKDNVYTDDELKFKMNIDDNWKVKVGKSPSKFRIAMSQKKYGIPSDYINVPDNTKIPSFVLYADTTTLGVFPFLDSLLSDTYESDQKKDIMKKFEFLYEKDIIPKGRDRFTIGEGTGVMWKAEAKYIKEVQTSTSSNAGKRVYGSYGGAIYIFKKDNMLLAGHLMCEWEFIDQILDELNPMIQSLNCE